MKRPDDVRRLLRWYPTSWRTRYEDEFLAFLEDRLKDSPLTWSFRSSVALEGLRERCYGSGLVGARRPGDQRRTGSLVVFVAWSIMAVGGAIMEITAEHFSVSMPEHTRSLAQFAYDTTVAAGVAGSLLVVVGSSVALPGFHTIPSSQGVARSTKVSPDVGRRACHAGCGDARVERVGARLDLRATQWR